LLVEGAEVNTNKPIQTHRAAAQAMDELAHLRGELAEARELLRAAISHVNTHAFSSADRLAERIEAFLDPSIPKTAPTPLASSESANRVFTEIMNLPKEKP